MVKKVLSCPPIHPFDGSLSAEAQLAACAVMTSGQIAAGPLVQEFEAAIGGLTRREHAVAINDMTTALALALHLAGVGPNDDVMSLAFSCMSSNAAVARVGANIVWVDLDPRTASVSLADLELARTSRTKALMVYHIAGYPAAIREISAFCRLHGIILIEDCNAALGAVDPQGLPVGGTGDFAVCSFYPNRLINAIEGAVLICPSAETAERARRLRRYGIDSATFRDSRGEIDAKSDITEIGWAGSLSQLHAAVGLETAATASTRLTRVRQIAERLNEASSGTKAFWPVQPVANAKPAFWVYLVLTPNRDKLKQHLLNAGIHTTQLHQRNDVYSGFHATQRKLPGTDRLAAQLLALPCGWWIDEAGLDRMFSALVSAPLE